MLRIPSHRWEVELFFFLPREDDYISTAISLLKSVTRQSESINLFPPLWRASQGHSFCSGLDDIVILLLRERVGFYPIFIIFFKGNYSVVQNCYLFHSISPSILRQMHTVQKPSEKAFPDDKE